MSLDLNADLINIALYGLFLASVVGLPLYVLRGMERQFRGEFGRSYALVVSDMFEEGVRRSTLMARIAEMRSARIERQERRLEGGR